MLPLVLPQEQVDCPDGQNQCSSNVQNHIQGVVDEVKIAKISQIEILIIFPIFRLLKNVLSMWTLLLVLPLKS